MELPKNASNSDVNSEQPQKFTYSNPEVTKPKRVLRELVIKHPTISLGDLSTAIKRDVKEIAKELLLKGATAKTIVRFEEIENIVIDYGFRAVRKATNPADLKLRPPVITIMGHVDHGKTTLLDALRNSRIAEGEFGGITQKIGAFTVRSREGRIITVIDTPGHEAFSNMRRRGAQVTDMIILVVSAVDGVQQQTLESIQIAAAANVPVIVAVNKIDVAGSDPQDIEKELFAAGLMIEPHGGNIPVVHISAKTKQNVDLLEELILFQAELMELKANNDCYAEGIVLESRKGTIGEAKSCTVVVQKGTLKVNDNIMGGDTYGRVRLIRDDRNESLSNVTPGHAVEISGMKELPGSGDTFFVVKDENIAKMLWEKKQRQTKSDRDSKVELITKGDVKVQFDTSRERREFHSGNFDKMVAKYDEAAEEMKAKLADYESKVATKPHLQPEIESIKKALLLHDKWMAEMVAQSTGENKINIILKAKDKSTLEALTEQIEKMAKTGGFHDDLKILSSGVGDVTSSDIDLASKFKGIILGMDTNLTSDLAQRAKNGRVEVHKFQIIYGVLDLIKKLAARIEANKPKNKETAVKVSNESKILGAGQLKSLFEIKVSKNNVKKIAGVQVKNGKFTKTLRYRIIRNAKTIAEDLELSNLKRFKDEVREVKRGDECGVSFVDFEDLQEGDVIEAY